jgi:hypothetical protein
MTQQDLLQAASQLSASELEDFVAKITAIYQERQSAPGLVDTTHPELLAAIDRVDQRQGLVTFIADEWNAKYHVA